MGSRSFTAHRAGNAVTLKWRVAADHDTLGFNILRSRGATRVRANRALIPARTPGARTYAWRDRSAPERGALRYWLQVIAADGSRAVHGPAKA